MQVLPPRDRKSVCRIPGIRSPASVPPETRASHSVHWDNGGMKGVNTSAEDCSAVLCLCRMSSVFPAHRASDAAQGKREHTAPHPHPPGKPASSVSSYRLKGIPGIFAILPRRERPGQETISRIRTPPQFRQFHEAECSHQCFSDYGHARLGLQYSSVHS